jgi:extradiol dioxygenase family protein
MLFCKWPESFRLSARGNRIETLVLTAFQTNVKVRDIAEARRFYHGVLGCVEVHSDEQRLDFNLYGHHLVCHLDPQLGKQGRVAARYLLVASKWAPVSQWSVAVEATEWQSLAKRLKEHRVKFVTERHGYLGSAPGAQATLFLVDPSGNALDVQLFHKSFEKLLRRERQRTLARWMLWAILGALVLCWCLLQAKKSLGEMGAGELVVPARIASCESMESCLRSGR